MHETIIAADCRVDGDIEAQRLRVFGTVAGAVTAHEVVVEGSGHLHGALRATAVQIFGRVDGPIMADRVMIEAGASSLGGISAPSVSLAEGCTIQGRLDSNLPAMAAPSPAPGPSGFFQRAAGSAFATNPPATAAQVSVPRYAPSQPPAAAALPVTPQPPAPSPAPALPVETTPPKPSAPRRPTKAPKSAPTGFSLDGITLRLED